MKEKSLAHISLLSASFVFGANYWIAKSIMPTFTPFQIVSFRIIVATIIFWVISFFVKQNTKIPIKDILIISLAGVLGVSLNQFFFFSGLEYSTPVETSILHTLSPLIVALFAIWLLKEKVSFRKFLGIFLGFVGAIIIVSSGKIISFSDLHFKGNIFILLNISAYSLYLIIIKPIMAKYHYIHMLKYLFLAGAISYMPFGFTHIYGASFSHVTVNEWLALSYVILGTTVLTYFLVAFSIKKLTATIVGFYIYLQPFVATSIGYINGKEQLTVAKMIATLLLFVGIWLVLKNEKPKKIK